MIAVIGAGKMGEALVSGLLSAGASPDELLITERYDERARELSERYGVKAVSNAEAAQLADTLVLAVKPQDMTDLLVELSEVITPAHLVVTIAAGITTAAIEQQLAAGVLQRPRRHLPSTAGHRIDRAHHLKWRQRGGYRRASREGRRLGSAPFGPRKGQAGPHQHPRSQQRHG